MNKYSGFILKIVRQLEERFNCIAYAHVDENGKWWNVCIDNYDIYMKDLEFKKFTHAWHIIAKKRGIQILFCYCKPLESKLGQLAKEENLVMNI